LFDGPESPKFLESKAFSVLLNFAIDCATVIVHSMALPLPWRLDDAVSCP
jgi:hypothetical protein